jgi:hypothetical protein
MPTKPIDFLTAALDSSKLPQNQRSFGYASGSADSPIGLITVDLVPSNLGYFRKRPTTRTDWFLDGRRISRAKLESALSAACN